MRATVATQSSRARGVDIVAAMPRLASWCFLHRRLVLAGWIVALVALSALHGAAGSGYKDSFKLSGTQSSQALALLQRAAPKAAGDTDRIVVATTGGAVTDPPVRARVQTMLGQVARLPHVSAIGSPYGPGGAPQIARARRIAYATVTFDKQANDLPVSAVKRVVSVAQSAAGNGLQIELGGQAIERTSQPGAGGAGIGFAAAAVVLLLAFGSILAAALPLITAAVSLGVGIAIIGLLSNVLTMASFSS